MKILVIEDHPKIREGIIQMLKKEHYDVFGAVHGEEALKILQKQDFDLIILDINMPIMNGKQFLIQFRTFNPVLPIIALTSNSMIDDKIEMFDLGCDDYITKPFDIKELMIRIQNIFKRTQNQSIQTSLTINDIEIDVVKHRVYKNNHTIDLPRKQYLILEYLAINRGVTKNKADILEKVWGESEENLNFDSVTLESHISSLRKKLGKTIIQTQKGFGYLIP